MDRLHTDGGGLFSWLDRWMDGLKGEPDPLVAYVSGEHFGPRSQEHADAGIVFFIIFFFYIYMYHVRSKIYIEGHCRKADEALMLNDEDEIVGWNLCQEQSANQMASSQK